MKPLAWITGSAGLIGHHLVRTAPHFGQPWQPRPLARPDVDLTDFTAVERLFRQESPGLVIHCAALSRSPDCQAQPALAHLVNVQATTHLAQLAAAIPFLLFSSDLVFDGQKGGYIETDPPRPLNVYGETKCLAEQVVLANPRHTVLRTSLNAGASPAGNRSFNEEMALAWRHGQTLHLFTDEFRSPLPVEATARAVWELLSQSVTGLFHVAGRERLSRWQIGQILAARHPDLRPRIEPASTRDYAGPPRPADTSLDCSKTQRHLSFPLPGLSELEAWQTALGRSPSSTPPPSERLPTGS